MLGIIREAFWGFSDGIKFGWWQYRHEDLERAIVFVRQGIRFHEEWAHRIYVGDIGEMFAYGDDGLVYVMKGKVLRDDTTVEIPKPEDIEHDMKSQVPARKRWFKKHFYPDSYNELEGERVLFVVDGEVIASPVKGTGEGLNQASLSHFNRGDAIYQATHSFRVYGKGMVFGGLRLILAIVAIAIIGFVVYHFVIAPHLHAVSPTITPTPTPTPTPTGPANTPIFSRLMGLALTMFQG